MIDVPEPPLALLPTGFIDLLQHEAEAEARGIEAVMDVFASYGYERVRPPLLEFETSLLAGSGVSLSEQAFRLMDPESRKMMALRPDMTTQIARISATRLEHSPRPLRVSYAGPCVVVGNPGREAQRQISQAGIELVGPDSSFADAEIIVIAARALEHLKVRDVSFDLSIPMLARLIVDSLGVDESRQGPLRHALDRKDAAAVSRHGGSVAPILLRLLEAAGEADTALIALKALTLPAQGREIITRLSDVVTAVKAQIPDLRLTIDPVEFRGWQYHTGLCITIFAEGIREELGRGGRYRTWNDEAACGLTLRPEILLRAAPTIRMKERVYLPVEAEPSVGETLRREGYATISGLKAVADVRAEARRLSCRYVCDRGSLQPIE